MLVAKPEGKKPLRNPRHRLEESTEMDFKEIWWEFVAWIHLAQVRDRRRALLNTAFLSTGSIKGREFD
jgi:hypothetical protein